MKDDGCTLWTHGIGIGCGVTPSRRQFFRSKKNLEDVRACRRCKAHWGQCDPRWELVKTNRERTEENRDG